MDTTIPQQIEIVETSFMQAPSPDMDTDFLGPLSRADRKEWNQDMYKQALERVWQLKNFTWWFIAQLVDEIQQRWKLSYDVIAKELSVVTVSAETLKIYHQTYKRIIKSDPDYVPTGRLGSDIAHIASRTENPAATMNQFEDANVTSREGAYKLLKETQTGIKLPTLPKCGFTWNEDNTKIIPRIRGTAEALALVDWHILEQQIDLITSHT